MPHRVLLVRLGLVHEQTRDEEKQRRDGAEEERAAPHGAEVVGAEDPVQDEGDELGLAPDGRPSEARAGRRWGRPFQTCSGTGGAAAGEKRGHLWGGGGKECSVAVEWRPGGCGTTGALLDQLSSRSPPAPLSQRL